MAESLAHVTYVRKIVSYIENHFAPSNRLVVQADLAEYGRTPQIIGGYYPDVYVRTPNLIIIGEAKTDKDIENPHTEAQLMCYIDEVRTATFQEKHIVLSSSLYSFAMLKNMVVRRKKNDNLSDITFHILDNYTKVAVI